MLPDWRKVVVILSLVIVVVGVAMPDACADDAVTIASASAALSAPHTGDQPFGCQHEEDCFCCAHIAPMAVFAFHTSVVAIRTVEQPVPFCVEQLLSAPYHPPKA
jgi:hypothetical protein